MSYDLGKSDGAGTFSTKTNWNAKFVILKLFLGSVYAVFGNQINQIAKQYITHIAGRCHFSVRIMLVLSFWR